MASIMYVHSQILFRIVGFHMKQTQRKDFGLFGQKEHFFIGF